MTTDVVEGTAEELVPQPPSASLFRTDDPVEVVEKATRIADALTDVITRKELYVKVQGKTHVLVDGWTLLGSMLGVTAVCVATEPVEGGFKATVEARTTDGRVVGRADALCTKQERRGPWKTADDYARLSMAQTRATSKALKGPLGFIVSLAGYATTPAEEMTFTEPETSGPEPSTNPEPNSQVEGESQSERVTKDVARALLDRARQVGVSSPELSMWLTKEGVDHRPISNIGTGVAALRNVTVDQALKLGGWLSERAERQ